MKKLYCPECSAYLEGGDGECKDCHCGWTQPVKVSKPMALYASTNVEGSVCSIEIDVTEDEWNAMSEDSQNEIIGEFTGNVVDIWVAPAEE